MKQAQELLDNLRNTKRHGCMSEWQSWINDVAEFLEAQVVSAKAVEDPTIAGQLKLPLQPGSFKHQQFELLPEENDLLDEMKKVCTWP